MQLFCQLGDAVARRWAGAGHDPAAFTQLAVECLEELPAWRALDGLDVLRWVTAAETIPRQRELSRNFGQPAIQVYDGGDFYIEVLHWLDNTTEIHQHQFDGAFAVLAGSSIHSQYEFHSTRVIQPKLEEGRVELASVELLERGAIRPIVAGRRMIHSLFHVERPAVTVVVRTPQTDQAGPHRRYLYPRLALEGQLDSELLRRKSEAIATLAQLQQDDWKERLGAACAHADAAGMGHLALAAYRLFANGRDIRRTLEQGRATHGGLVDSVVACVAEQARQDVITGLRGRLRSPEHRLLLALVLCVPMGKGEHLHEVIRRKYPDRDPREAIARWSAEIRELMGPDDPRWRVLELTLR